MKKAKFKRWVPLYLMMAPGLIYLFINNYMPMAGLVVAFKNYNVVDGIFGSPWAAKDSIYHVVIFESNHKSCHRHIIIDKKINQPRCHHQIKRYPSFKFCFFHKFFLSIIWNITGDA